MKVPIQYPDGSTEEVEAESTADGKWLVDADTQRRIHAKQQSYAAPPSAATGAFTDPEGLTGALSDRKIAQGVGAVVGGVVGAAPGAMAMDPPAMAWGGLKGAGIGFGLAGQGYDFIKGDPNASRNLINGVTTGVIMSTPMASTLGLTGYVLGSGAVGAGVGVVQDTLAGSPVSPESVAGDFTANAVGGGIARGIGAVDAKLAANRPPSALRPIAEQNALQATAAREGIDLPVSAITGSPRAAFKEQSPMRHSYGQQVGYDYMVNAVRQTEDALVRGLDRFGALMANRQPTKLGQDLAGPALDHVVNTQQAAARQMYAAEEKLIGNHPVELGNYIEALHNQLRAVREKIIPDQNGDLEGWLQAALAKVQPNAPGGTSQARWSQLRETIGALRTKGTKSSLPGTMADRERSQLINALVKDGKDHIDALPMPDEMKAQIHHAVDMHNTAYGLSIEAVKDKIAQAIDKGDPDMVLPGLFKKDRIDQTETLRTWLKPEHFDQARTAFLAKSLADSGWDGSPGRALSGKGLPTTSLTKFANFWRPLIKSGQVDAMWPDQAAGPVNGAQVPETMLSALHGTLPPQQGLPAMEPHPTNRWIREMVAVADAMHSANKLAENNSQSGRALISDAQERGVRAGLTDMVTAPVAATAAGIKAGLLTALTVGAGTATHMGGSVVDATLNSLGISPGIPAGALAGGAMTLAAGTKAGLSQFGRGARTVASELGGPMVNNFLAYTRPGQALMTRAINGTDPTDTMRAVTRGMFIHSTLQGEKP